MMSATSSSIWTEVAHHFLCISSHKNWYQEIAGTETNVIYLFSRQPERAKQIETNLDTTETNDGTWCMRRTHAAEMADQISFLKDHSRHLGLAKKENWKKQKEKKPASWTTVERIQKSGAPSPPQTTRAFQKHKHKTYDRPCKNPRPFENLANLKTKRIQPLLLPTGKKSTS